VEHNAFTAPAAQRLLSSIAALPDEGVIDLVPHGLYAPHEALARRRIPRDRKDWPAVAVAITFRVGILTNDRHFLGCGCATWTVETLRTELVGDGSVEEATADEESLPVTVTWLAALDGATPLPEEPATTITAVTPFATGVACSSGSATATPRVSLTDMPPVAVILLNHARIEQQLHKTLRRAEAPPDRGGARTLAALAVQRELIRPETREVIDRLTALRNLVAHGQAPTDLDARRAFEYSELAGAVCSALQSDEFPAD
jgi:hypothetical protein